MRTAKFLLATLLLLVATLSVSTYAEKSCSYYTQRTQCGDLACPKTRNVCVACQADADCYPSGMQCNLESGRCKVKSFTSLLSASTVFAMIGGFLICSVGVIAGVGGGGILVPMFAGLIHLPMLTAVGLSQSTICGQSMLNMWFAVQQKYPSPTWDRPLINYQYLSLLLPLGLIGTLIGSILSKLCSDVLRVVLLFLLLSAVLYRTVKKVRKQYEKDREAQQAVVVDGDGTGTTGQYGGCNENQEADKALGNPNDKLPDGAQPTPVTPSEGQEAPQRGSQPQYPTVDIAMNFSCFFVLLIFNIFRSYASCNGAIYWLCVVVPLIFLSCSFVKGYKHLSNLSESHPENLTFTWNVRTSFYYPMVAVVAGAGAAMLGIGGGLVLGFVLYEVGLIPEEASVTGGMGTFFIAFSSTIQLLVTGSLRFDLGFAFFLVGMSSTALGTFVFMKYIKEHGLSYLIIVCLACVIGGSLVVLGGYGIYNAVVTAKNGGSVMSRGHLCGA